MEALWTEISSNKKNLFFLCIPISIVIFIIDILIPLGVAGGMPYIIVILLSLWLPDQLHSIYAGLLTTLLTFLGFGLSPSEGIMWMAITNRFLAVSGIWIGVFFVIKFKNSLIKLNESNTKFHLLSEELEKRVALRTYELEESQKLYKVIARNFPNGVINVFDRNLHYIFVEGMELYKKGITGEKLIGSSFIKRISPSIQEEIKSKLMSVFDGIDTDFELNTEGKSYMINAVALPDLKGEVNQILMVSQNITSLKRAEKNIQKALKKEQRLNELKSRFVSMASHEFRTPLTSIMNSATLLSKYVDVNKDENTNKQLKHIVRIKNSVRHLTNILNDFLSLGKLEEGKIALHYSSFNLVEFATEISEDMQGMIKKGQSITYSHNGKEDVFLDKQMLKNILNNLLSNAIKYSPEQSEIIFKTNHHNKHLFAEITDKGIGIPEEEQGHLFERFFRAKNVFDIQGTGLGLNIVKKYIDLAKGSIDFESKQGKGTSFKIKLPVKSKD